MKKYSSVEDIVCAWLELTARYDDPKGVMDSTFWELGVVLRTAPTTSDQWGRVIKADLEAMFARVFDRLERRGELGKWVCWVLVRVRRASQKEAKRAHNTWASRACYSTQDQRHISGKTAASWAREVDGMIEGCAAAMGRMKYNAGGLGPVVEGGDTWT